MSKIIRDMQAVADNSFGLIVVGGGIYGAMIALSAARRGVSALVLEQNDFSSGTSFNSLKRIHSGLPYLQRLNLKLYFQYVRERRWYLRTLPHLVHPLPVLMPLYNRGLKRKSLLRIALALDKMLSSKRNTGIDPQQYLPFGKIIDREETVNIFQTVEQKALKGSALWYDAIMPDPQLLLLSILKQACALGSTALNYCQVNKLIIGENQVAGVSAIDQISSRKFEFFAPIVVNATGSWVRELSGLFDAEYADLFKYAVAWNILFKRDGLSSHALAITPRKRKAQTYFLHSWNNKLFAGTGYAPRNEFSEDPHPTEEELNIFINDLNLALPEINLSVADIDHIYTGLVPVKKDGKTEIVNTSRFFDHSRYGGPSGLYSITGVRYAAARRLSEHLMDRLFPGLKKLSITELVFDDRKNHRFTGAEFFQDPVSNIQAHAAFLKSVIDNEAVIHLDDLILRRTNIGDNPATALRVAPQVADLFGWDDQRKTSEIERLRQHFRYHRST